MGDGFWLGDQRRIRNGRRFGVEVVSGGFGMSAALGTSAQPQKQDKSGRRGRVPKLSKSRLIGT